MVNDERTLQKKGNAVVKALGWGMLLAWGLFLTGNSWGGQDPNGQSPPEDFWTRDSLTDGLFDQ